MKKKSYHLVGDEYNQTISKLKSLNFKVNKWLDDKLAENEARVLVVNFNTQDVGFFPLGMYAPHSPLTNKEKFDHYVKQCCNYIEFKQDIVK